METIGIVIAVIVVIIIIAYRTPGSKPPTITGGTDTDGGWIGKL